MLYTDVEREETSREQQHTLECALETLSLSLAERTGRVGSDVVISRQSGDGRRPHGGVRGRRVGHGAAIRGRRSDELTTVDDAFGWFGFDAACEADRSACPGGRPEGRGEIPSEGRADAGDGVLLLLPAKSGRAGRIRVRL